MSGFQIDFNQVASCAVADVASDPAEANDLAQSHAQQAQTLRQELNRWRKETGAPLPSTLNPDLDAHFNPAERNRIIDVK